MSPTSPRVRVRWSPAAALSIEELSLDGHLIEGSREHRGGSFEAALPEAPLRPLLRWRLHAGATHPVDEIHIEVRDAAGGWHLVGELLGELWGSGGWRGERLVPCLGRALEKDAGGHRLAAR